LFSRLILPLLSGTIFFRKAFDDKDDQDETWNVDINDISPKVLKILEQWLYDQKLEASLAPEEARRSLPRLVDLWLLCRQAGDSYALE
jgi:hypothetical protein